MRSIQFHLEAHPHLIMALGFCVGSVAVVGDRVYVTKVLIDGDSLKQRIGLPREHDLTFTYEVDGWERDAVLRAIEPHRIYWEVRPLFLVAICIMPVLMAVLLVWWASK